MDNVPLELMIEFLKYLDSYEILTSTRCVCIKFFHASQLLFLTRVTIDSMPFRVLQKICSHLHVRESMKLSQANNNLRKSIKESPSPFLRTQVALHPLLTESVGPILIDHFQGTSARVRVRLYYLLRRTLWDVPQDVMRRKLAIWPPANKVVIQYTSVKGLLRPIILEKDTPITIRYLIEGLRMLLLAPLSAKQSRDTDKFKRFQDFLKRQCKADKEGLARLIREINNGTKKISSIEGFKGFEPDISPVILTDLDDNAYRDMYFPPAVVDQRSLLKSKHPRRIDLSLTIQKREENSTVAYLDVDIMGPLSYDVDHAVL